MPNFTSRAIGATLALLAILASPITAEAGPVADFECALRNAYADYRAALFQTNAKNARARGECRRGEGRARKSEAGLFAVVHQVRMNPFALSAADEPR